jgi:galactokinase
MERVFSAPGRVNLIGEHTDYNDGYVMPVALNRHTHVRITPRDDRQLSVYSVNLRERAIASLDALSPRQHWSDYVFGVAALLQQRGVALSGASLSIASDVPIGAGLSSSAALEVATAKALLASAGITMDAVTLARLCQRAENEFVGARVGIMDQFVALTGQPDHALVLDCRSLAYALIALPAGVRLVVANTMVKHALAASEYNKRRADCEDATRALSTRLPQVKALRDVTLNDLDEHGGLLTGVQNRRARHVISENQRVTAAAEALSRGDIAALRPLFAASHRSLGEDYEVTCDELDALVDLAATAPGACASRMTGGGFGGCTVNLVNGHQVDEFIAAVAAGYARHAGRTAEFYV